jgi:hypothetical protein
MRRLKNLVPPALLLGLVLLPARALAAAAAPDFGPNVKIFDPSMPAAAIKEQLDKAWEAQKGSEFGTQRDAFLFKPGEYKLDVGIGYYMQVLGLGASPDAVHITGNVHAGPARGNHALSVFWRSIENFSVTPTGGVMQWAVSQAAPFRRMHIKGDVVLHQNRGYASGGWMSDSLIDGKVAAGPQQQWIARNAEWGSWTGANWNMVFVGVVHAPEGDWPKTPVTRVDEVPVIREKPYLTIDAAGKFKVHVPALRHNTSGITWRAGSTPGKDIPIGKFYIAHADTDTAATINAQLAKGKHLLFTPGIYSLTAPIRVTRANTVVMGLGMATLIATNGNALLQTADVDGITIAGLIFDAGAEKSPVLVQIGPADSRAKHAANPTVLFDVFFRDGGPAVGRAGENLEINAQDTIVDHTWIWRADHGNGVGWTSNTSANGIVVNGDNVTVYGLFVEHHQEFQTLWNGNGGRVYLYQCELPYDPPDQASYRSTPDTNGWAAYKVADKVTTHDAWGLGIYSVFRHPNIVLTRGVEKPKKPGVRFHNVVTICIGKNGEISNVIDDTGGATKPNVTYNPRVTESP